MDLDQADLRIAASLKAYLIYRTGKRFTATQLASFCKYPNPEKQGQKIRALIHHLRTTDCPNICSDSRGYWYSTDPVELTATAISLRERAASIDTVASALERHAEILRQRMRDEGRDQGELFA